MNEEYKRKHPPAKPGQSKYHQGYFIPKNPEKCLTPTNCIYRSEYERVMYEFCDRNPSIKRWASEPISIKYMAPDFKYCKKFNVDINDKKFYVQKNYHIDMWIEIEDQNDPTKVRKIFIEIKPYDQTIPPKPIDLSTAKPAKIRSYNKSCMQYIINKQKWIYAEQFCKERGCEFMIVTEVTLKKLGLKL